YGGTAFSSSPFAGDSVNAGSGTVNIKTVSIGALPSNLDLTATGRALAASTWISNPATFNVVGGAGVTNGVRGTISNTSMTPGTITINGVSTSSPMTSASSINNANYTATINENGSLVTVNGSSV